MIVKGQFKTFGFWFSITAFVGGVATVFYWLLKGFNDTPVVGQIFLGVVLLLLICIYGNLLLDANIIAIDTTSKKVTFKNLLTRQISRFNFSDFDGKLVWYEPINGGRVRNFYFIKNKKAIKKISGFIFSNQKELEESLMTIRDLGTTKYSFLKSLKVLFGFPIID